MSSIINKDWNYNVFALRPEMYQPSGTMHFSTYEVSVLTFIKNYHTSIYINLLIN